MLVWIGFLIFVFVLLALDLGVFHRKAHVVSVREALTWTVVWIATALGRAVAASVVTTTAPVPKPVSSVPSVS